MNNGKEYENLIAEFYEKLAQQLGTNAIVTPNDSIIGKISGVKRQIDVSIRYKFLDVEHLTIIEVKDFNKPINVKALDGFASVIKEVGANKGIIVSAKGFSKAAMNVGKYLGIECLTLHSAQNKNWETLLKLNIKKSIHYFDMEDHFLISLGDKATKGMSITLDTYSYDKINIISVAQIAYDNIILKNSWKEITRGNQITFTTKERKLFHLLDHDMMPADGYLRLKYNKSSTTKFQIEPTNYNYVVDHIKNTGKLHDLTVSIEILDRIEKEDFKNDSNLNDDPHIVANIFMFNNANYFVTYKFLVNGFITGEVFHKGNQIMSRDGRGEHLVKLESILRAKS